MINLRIIAIDFLLITNFTNKSISLIILMLIIKEKIFLFKISVKRLHKNIITRSLFILFSERNGICEALQKKNIYICFYIDFQKQEKCSFIILFRIVYCF